MAQFFFFRRLPRATPPAGLPTGMRVYAIGDVHGRLDCLKAAEQRIRDHLRDQPAVGETSVIFLGDYIDRGPSSREVIDALGAGMFAGLPARFLLGNHEDAMLHFLASPRDGIDWLAFGGRTTLASYGLRPGVAPRPAELAALAGQLSERLPPDHLRFLHDLELSIELGGFLFVHAGVRPGIVLAKQNRRDLLSIRDPFLRHPGPLPWRVVHGHTIVSEPQITDFRVSLDTGAYATGVLSCAVIEGETVEILARSGRY